MPLYCPLHDHPFFKNDHGFLVNVKTNETGKTTLKPRQDITVNKLCFEYAHESDTKTELYEKAGRISKDQLCVLVWMENNLKFEFFSNTRAK